MALILNIDTATENASVAICENGSVVGLKESAVQKEHASFVHTAIHHLIAETGITLPDINAVAITSGPGSYTGLRVSMAAAKGLCYALNIPLIAVNTLEMMSMAAIDFLRENHLSVSDDTWLVPMIDARRMEVFTATYDVNFVELEEPRAIVLNEEILVNWNASHQHYFFGNGSNKILNIIQNYNGIITVNANARHLGKISEQKFLQECFADLAYLEPSYFKEFYTNIKT